jgi:chloramphenicol-sensitive protein RarD
MSPSGRPAEAAAAGARAQARAGAASALAAFAIWGFAPVYFRAVAWVPNLEVLAHRVVWSLALVALMLALGRGWRAFAAVFRSRRELVTFTGTALLVAVNWGVFVWAIAGGRVLQVSLGYYINPLFVVLIAVLVLGERMNRWQTLALGLAAIGVLNLTIAVGELPWEALTLAVSFAFYGLLRKTARAEALVGLAVETALLAPLAAGYIAWLWLVGEGVFLRQGAGTDLMLLLSAPVTALPLFLFARGARRLKLSTIGIFQYLSPSLHFLSAVLLFGEPFTSAHLVTFACIWTALGLFTWDSMRRGRAG